MAHVAFCRGALRRNALPLGLGLTSGLVLLNRQQPMRFDAIASSPPLTKRPFSEGPSPGQKKERLNPEIIKQLSGGSLGGFLTGLLVSVFSKTLVLLIGLGIVFIQVAAHYGVDVVDQLKLKKRIRSSRILAALNHNPTFKIAFGVTFAMSAFMSF
ncbi:hypothetical protein B0T25DRAFT_167591 [Lasiosphaeria hispida]|uniref:Fun14 family protein n=1 Tax=Lasiosphaeria hispida TaxID=260671 RepID=A0AAJ0HN97_9PEZI|nr:hypothetical protein B0T25DRAFT_167591 [Lasiosphaeria hispida]